MASLCRNVAVLLFFVSTLMHSHLFAHASTSSPPITRKRITFLIGLGSDTDNTDYDNYSSPPAVVPSVKIPRLYSDFVCQYDPCLENQEPCDHLKAKTGCLCPGRSGGDKPPHAPRIRALLPITEGENAGKIEVQWCAPQSVVSSYKVIVEGSDNVMEFGDAFRRGSVGSLEVGTKICVEAVNNAGHSSPSDFSCKRFGGSESSDHKLMAGVIGGGVAFILLLVIVAVVLCRRQMCQKARRESVIGLGNPSYKAERAS